jgi:hypothetical protein
LDPLYTIPSIFLLEDCFSGLGKSLQEMVLNPSVFKGLNSSSLKTTSPRQKTDTPLRARHIPPIQMPAQRKHQTRSRVNDII